MRNLLTGAPAAATTLCLYALLVTACSPADSDTAAVAGAADVPSLESLTHTQKQDLEDAGYSVPFSGSGQGDYGAFSFEFPADYQRDRLTLYFSCAGAEGEGQVTVSTAQGTSHHWAPCPSDEAPLPLTGQLWTYGDGLDVTVEEMPDGAVWSFSFATAGESR